MTDQPQLWVFAGPNGAGKSTLVDRYASGRLPVINPDNIARETFGFETTLSGNSELKLMRDASAAGYKVNLVYVGIPNAAASAFRVAERVRAGGHDVPREHTDRRYARTMTNLPVAINIADRSFVFDNGGKRHRLLLVRENGRTRFETPDMPGWATRAIPADLTVERQRGRPLAAARSGVGKGRSDLLGTGDVFRTYQTN